MASAMVAAAARQYASSGRAMALSQRLTKRSFATNTSGLAALSHRLTKQFSAANDNHGSSDGASTASNLVFSPLSIHSALSLVALGSRGSTLSELLDALGEETRDGLAENVRDMVERAFPVDPQPGGPRVAYASALWHEATRTMKPAYCYAAASSCRATVRAVDFLSKSEEAIEQINSWVAAATNNLIDSIVGPDSVNKSTRFVITNAVYFKGRWETPFDKSNTMEHKFHRMDGSAIDAQFMSSRKDQFIATHDGFKVLKMPYEMSDNVSSMGSSPPWTMPPRYSMCVFLPDARDGLWSLEDRMASSPGFVHEHLPEKPVKVGEFRVPKFKLSFFDSITPALQNLGITTMFTQGAQLPDMLEDDGCSPLSVSDVLHKAVIEVNEEGTEAAACTAITMYTCCFQRERPVLVDFVADHPFAFCVVEEVSSAILFRGTSLIPHSSPSFLHFIDLHRNQISYSNKLSVMFALLHLICDHIDVTMV